jgi:hypothetical protein
MFSHYKKLPERGKSSKRSRDSSSKQIQFKYGITESTEQAEKLK